MPSRDRRPGQAEQPIKTAVCELAKDPDRFNTKAVEVGALFELEPFRVSSAISFRDQFWATCLSDWNACSLPH